MGSGAGGTARREDAATASRCGVENRNGREPNSKVMLDALHLGSITSRPSCLLLGLNMKIDFEGCRAKQEILGFQPEEGKLDRGPEATALRIAEVICGKSAELMANAHSVKF